MQTLIFLIVLFNYKKKINLAESTNTSKMKKKIIILCLFSPFYLLLIQDLINVITSRYNIRRIGLTLWGGGAMTFAHVSILKLIDSVGIKVNYIFGISMGGILGGLYAMGYSVS
ncbi:hypothetical protein [Chryseobacterium cucumeris]|uniref:hypothetical protein n=1 Tax=Chryseobacterium cucumeris TaxID=1813611 RepID=UPI0023F0AAD1|nr:hypothetical protein [Chryseobacterium cucumeris]